MTKKTYANDPQASRYQQPRKAGSGDALMNTAGALLGAGAAYVGKTYYDLFKTQAELMKDGKGHKVKSKPRMGVNPKDLSIKGGSGPKGKRLKRI